MTGSEEPVTIDKRLNKMGEDLGALRVLYEHHDTQIQRIVEVQVDHGKTLEEHGTLLREIEGEIAGITGEFAGMKSALGGIRGDLAPLRDLPDFVRRIADGHERRISALEKPASAPQAGLKTCATFTAAAAASARRATPRSPGAVQLRSR